MQWPAKRKQLISASVMGWFFFYTSIQGGRGLCLELQWVCFKKPIPHAVSNEGLLSELQPPTAPLHSINFLPFFLSITSKGSMDVSFPSSLPPISLFSSTLWSEQGVLYSVAVLAFALIIYMYWFPPDYPIWVRGLESSWWVLGGKTIVGFALVSAIANRLIVEWVPGSFFLFVGRWVNLNFDRLRFWAFSCEQSGVV